MKFIASFDIGTTNVKGVLVGQGMGIHLENNVTITLQHSHGQVEQDPESWYAAVSRISKAWFQAGVKPKDIELLTFSGQMQDCIPVGANGKSLRPAILYSDGRGGEQASRLRDELGDEIIHLETGNHMDGTLTFPKMIWLKEHEPEMYARTHSFLISSKDYVIRQLTGVCVTDPTSAATTGCMQIRSRTWMERWLEAYGISWFKMPPVVRSDEVVGYVHQQGERDTGFAAGTPVLCGIGDAGAATLGAGVFDEGEIYAYVGTTGWVAAVSESYKDVRSGTFNLSYVEEGRQICTAPLTNAGNAHQWAVELFGPVNPLNAPSTFEDFELSLERVSRGGSGVIFLPYLNGERCPIQDVNATGCFIGLKPTTTKEEMGVAVLEGVALSMREVMGLIVRADHQKRVILMGGGAKSKVWTQIIADVLQCELVVPADSQYLPSIGAAMLGFRRAGWGTDYDSLCTSVKAARKYESFWPNRGLSGYYDRLFGKYKKLYPALAPLFD